LTDPESAVLPVEPPVSDEPPAIGRVVPPLPPLEASVVAFPLPDAHAKSKSAAIGRARSLPVLVSLGRLDWIVDIDSQLRTKSGESLAESA
jgi:hypothetical protein